jgi:hypothetical protein
MAEAERTMIREVTVTFNYKLVEVNNKEFNDVYNVLYVRFNDGHGKEFEFNYVVDDSYTPEEISKDLVKLAKLLPLGNTNVKIFEGLKEEMIKKIADLLWKM